MMRIEQAAVVSHEAVRGGYRVLTFAAPAIAREAAPGQFVHLSVAGLIEASLRRPFSVYAAEKERIAIMYKPVGAGTRAMTRLAPGETVSLMGPLGRGFPTEAAEGRHAALVAGGYGLAPLCFLARRLGRPGTVFVGAATAAVLPSVGELSALGWDTRTATEDGTAGESGLITEALDRWLAEAPEALVCYACGPNGLLRAVAERAARGGWPAWVSLERRMGCGAGACLACVQKVRTPEGTQWARVCRDGPVFNAAEIAWEESDCVAPTAENRTPARS
ncbi:MAG: dihydroorotate dehydrogenase electron transfer subunit [Lentisphaerae bacterium]|nr:dihydroorotate dehydrogenase electron transfer subunit [Lentisphaerota bacterium]